MSAQWPAPAPRIPDHPADDSDAGERAATADPLTGQIYEPDPHRETLPGIAQEPRPLWKRAGGWLVAIGLLALKFGKAAFLLLKGAKIFTTAGSMIISVVAYSFIWGWKFAVGFVLLLLVHEMGHVIQLRREGIPASAPMFIPFLGAVVMAKSLGDNAIAEARVGLAGPVLGTLGALALLPIAINTGDDFWYALIFTGLLLNLFNLLPVVPLDGGRAMAALSPRMWFVGFALLVVLTFVFPNPIMFLILLVGGYETYKRWKARKSGDPEVLAFYKVKPAHRVAVAAVYLTLILVCVIGMDLTHIERDIPR
ncbi:MAG: site-2 protease family protein [Solirubrobacterales bacterium]|nr:site-2 protease family protein [Solirubrobacterales bacterium]